MKRIVKDTLVIGLVTMLLLSVAAAGFWAFTSMAEDVYAGYIRNIVQYTCGEVTQDDLVYRLKPGRCRFANLEFDTIVSADADGFRNTSVAPAPDVAVLGDSYAMGWGVADDEVLSSVLARLTGKSVRNLAISSWATPRELMALIRYAPAARIVVLQYCDNDYEENRQFVEDPQYFDRHREKLTGWFLDAQRGFDANYQRALPVRILRGLKAVIRQKGPFPQPSARADALLEGEAAVFGRVIHAFGGVLRDKKLILFESNSFTLNRPGFKAAFDKALAASPGLDVTVLDVTSVLTPSDYYRLDGHLNARGHAAVARAIAQRLP